MRTDYDRLHTDLVRILDGIAAAADKARAAGAPDIESILDQARRELYQAARIADERTYPAQSR